MWTWKTNLPCPARCTVIRDLQSAVLGFWAYLSVSVVEIHNITRRIPAQELRLSSLFQPVDMNIILLFIYTLVVYLLSMYNALIRNMTWVFGGFVYYCQLLYNTLSIYLVTYSCFILLLWKKLQKVLEISLLDILYKILFSKEVQLWTY